MNRKLADLAGSEVRVNSLGVRTVHLTERSFPRFSSSGGGGTSVEGPWNRKNKLLS